ncbi:MAG TPA: hypothetical protein VE871_19090 [Longimicrobium sp.]|nr:hypothetical protein [Longimicrobium sp.]
MRKHKLQLDDLAVKTFATAAMDEALRGTVAAHQSGAATCATCVNYLCWGSRNQTPCCTRVEYNCSLPGVC